MSFLSKPSTTTALLALIALLLLIQVVQSATRPKPPMMPPMSMQSAPPPNMPGHNHPPIPENDAPMPGGGAPIMGEDSNFDHAQMIYASMNCPNDPTMTLGDAGCTGGEADQRRQMVQGVLAKDGSSIRAVFDAVVGKYGEASLTAQALEIRRSRRR
ncbi:MAG TPA: hypothetical protein VI895_02445 [Bdellovibrionota bacterium]|nr:hypothetical protein [Bdellovibrionota bacterium]